MHLTLCTNGDKLPLYILNTIHWRYIEMATEKPRFTITVDDDLFKALEDYRFENRYNTRSEATNNLLRVAIEYLKEDPEEFEKFKTRVADELKKGK